MHEVHLPHYKQLVADPSEIIPKSMALLQDMFRDDAQRENMISRIRAGAIAVLKGFKKHNGWMYEALGIVLAINTPSAAGVVARA